MIVTIGTEGSSSDSGKLFAGVDVLENRFIEARKVLMAFLEHGLEGGNRKWHSSILILLP